MGGMTAFERGRTDGYQDTVNYYRIAVNPDYAAGVREGRAYRANVRLPLANAHGEVTFESIMGFMKRTEGR